MLKDVSARKGRQPYQSEDVGRGYQNAKNVKDGAIKSEPLYIWAPCHNIQLDVIHVASLLGQGLDSSWGCGRRMVNICIERDRASIF